MGYNYSATDYSNIGWFRNNNAVNSLIDISINGSIRGLTNVSFHMDYPISAIAGKNGCGKSTLLALAACAFHNETDYTPFNQNKRYYTFGDFFAFTSDETGIPGVSIKYTVKTNHGDKTDIRKKKPSGKWNDYNTRFPRRVVFMGINRIVPPSESSVHKTNRRLFRNAALNGELEQKIIEHMRHIFGQPYEHMSLLSHYTHHLFQLQRNDIKYTGFNMGAGENAILQLLIELYKIGKGGLLVIDEIELGIHVEAQKKLIDELKKICLDRQCQIICSTHSKYILDELPPEGRFLIENRGTGCSQVFSKISSEYAFGKMAGQITHELVVYTEDEVAKKIVASLLPCRLRERIDIVPIGSDQAVIRQLAARYREHKLNCLAFIDGDKSTRRDAQIREIKRALEDRVDEGFDNWAASAVNYLPGETWPERFIVYSADCEDAIRILADRWGAPEDAIKSLIESAEAAPEHDEIYCMARRLNLELSIVWADIVYAVKQAKPDEVRVVENVINNALNGII